MFLCWMLNAGEYGIWHFITVLVRWLQVGERLGKFEVEKRQAVEGEDYDKAKLKKVQMDDYRLQMYKQLEIFDLLQVIYRSEAVPIWS